MPFDCVRLPALGSSGIVEVIHDKCKDLVIIPVRLFDTTAEECHDSFNVRISLLSSEQERSESLSLFILNVHQNYPTMLTF